MRLNTGMILMIAPLSILLCASLYGQSPGVEIGITYYDFQTVGPIGNRIAACEDGSWHACWTGLSGWPYPPVPRHAYYAWYNPAENLIYTSQLDVCTNGGEPTIDLIYANSAAVAYYESNTRITLAIGTYPPGYFNPPDSILGSYGTCYWPYLTVNQNDNIHILMTGYTDRRIMDLAYTRSTDGGINWISPVLIDTVIVIGSVIDASPVSNRTAIGYSKALDTTTQWHNDIVYAISEDGLYWDFNDIVNITDYGNDDDSLSACNDIDIIFDYNDYLHVVWAAQWVSDEGIYYPTFLFHYCEQTGEIHEITHHPDGNIWNDICGTWNRPVCKLNMGVYDLGGDSDAIFVTWTQFDTSDVSAGGYGNGELIMSYTFNDGLTWNEPLNITNSPTPGCYPGECDSDHWASLADFVDDSLRILYLNDKDAGSVIQDEGAGTENPVKYLAIPNPLLTDIKNGNSKPVHFMLHQNHPNPFNESTIISFTLKKPSPVTLEIFDITGALVKTLIDEQLPAGQHQITWHTGDLASGIYFYKLTSNNNFQTRKAVIVK